MASPLEGVKVLDFGIFMAGPFTDRILADLGAEVIKIEEPFGDPMRSVSQGTLFLPTGKGKRSLAVDLRKPEGLELIYRLVPQVDIVHHNFRVGAADRMGIGYEKLSALNPRLIYCHSCGYGTRGPRALDPTFEPLHSAVCGLLTLTGGEGNAPQTYLTHMDYGVGLSTVVALLMALTERLGSGQGQFLETPQLAAGMLCASDAFYLNGKPSQFLQLDQEQTGHGAVNRLYPTAEGWICIACHTQGEWERLCQALDLAGLATDARFNNFSRRYVHRKSLEEILAERFLLRTAAQWAELLEGAGVPCELPRSFYGKEFLNSPDRVATGLVAESDHPAAGRLKEIGITMRLSETPAANRRPAPGIGEHSEEVLIEYGITPEEIAGLAERRVVRLGDSW